jgi:multiple sugar transport system substrate-binding protein
MGDRTVAPYRDSIDLISTRKEGQAMSRRMPRTFAGLAALGLIGSSLTACGTTASPSPAASAASVAPASVAAPSDSASAGTGTGETVEITFWSWAPGIDVAVAAYNSSQTAIKVKLDNANAGNAEYVALNTALSTGTGVPDAVQIEYQHLPAFIARGDLANLVDYGANDIKDQFVPWTWAQASQGDAVYAYPQDAGPMIQMCNKKLLDKYSIAVPTTWDEVTSAAAAIHKADKAVYLTNFTADQGHFFGLLWESGAKPFVVDGQNIKIDFKSPEVTRVAKLWGDLIKSGNLSPIDTYTPDWNTALGNSTIACWTAGAWGPSLIESAAKDLSGDWQVSLMPQWTAGGTVNGNYGGSTDAIPVKGAHPKEAEAFIRWLNTDPTETLALTAGKSNLFPVTQATLASPDWAGFKSDFWSGQETHKVMADAAQQVDVSFGWSPFTDFVYTTYAEELAAVKAGTITFEQAMQNVQDKSTTYAKDQGFTVQ